MSLGERSPGPGAHGGGCPIATGVIICTLTLALAAGGATTGAGVTPLGAGGVFSIAPMVTVGGADCALARAANTKTPARTDAGPHHAVRVDDRDPRPLKIASASFPIEAHAITLAIGQASAPPIPLPFAPHVAKSRNDMSNTPYLPGAKPRAAWLRSSRKTLILWVALIVLFLAVYQVMAPSSANDAGQRHRRSGAKTAVEQRRASDSSPWLPFATLLGVSALVIFLIRRNVRGARVFNERNNAALKLLAEGDVTAQRVRGFEELTKKAREPYLATARFQPRVRAVLQCGQLAEALAGYAAIDRTAVVATLRPMAAAQLALTHALNGDLDAADQHQWAVEAGKRLIGLADPRAANASTVTAEAVIGLRRGKYAEVMQLLQSRWNELEHTLEWKLKLRPIRVLRAFAEVQQIGVRGAGTAETWLASLRPARPSEFAPYRTTWPEMDAFLAANGL